MSHEVTKQPGVAARSEAWQYAALALAVALCYSNSLRAPFQFDDPRPHARLDYSTRPLVWASFALNRAISGADTWSYHLLNVLVHLGCGLLLLGILRRTWARADLNLARSASSGPALVTTLLWLCHPLQTESVTYLSQRAESMAAFFFLALLYAFIRSTSSARPLLWQALALLSLALGFATKEIIATAPLVVLLYDATFLERGPIQALGRRRGFYAALFLAALALFVLFVASLLFAERSTGFKLRSLGPLEYARTQPGVVLHYLRLAFWPHPLVFDYGWPIARSPGDYLPQTLAVAVLLGASIVLLARRSWIGFAGAWFFVILAPTSSFVPIKDAAFEHRVYLSLAAVMLAVVVAGGWVCRRYFSGARFMPHTLATSAVIALGTATVLRNQDYRSTVTLMQTVVAHAPDNARGHYNLGAALLGAGRTEEAIAELSEALRLNPKNDSTCWNLGMAYMRLKDVDRAIGFFERAVELEPRNQAQLIDLSSLLLAVGNPSKALEHIKKALEIPPNTAVEQLILGRCLASLGRFDEALAALREAARTAPEPAEPCLAFAQTVCSKPEASQEERREALRMARMANELTGSRRADVLETYAMAQAATGDFERAVALVEEALRLPLQPRDQVIADRLRRQLEEYRRSAGQ